LSDAAGGLLLVRLGYALQDGKSPLKKASSKGHVDVVKALIEAGANVNQADKVNI
jgi:ankyrin repeat protein